MASGTNTASKTVVLANNTTTANVTRVSATSATTGGAGAAPPASIVVALSKSLSPEFLTHLVNVAKDTLPIITVAAKDKMNLLDTGAPDTSSLQAQLQAMNKNEASANSTAPIDKVEDWGPTHRAPQRA